MMTFAKGTARLNFPSSSKTSAAICCRTRDDEEVKAAEEFGRFVTVDRKLIETSISSQNSCGNGEKVRAEQVRFLALNQWHILRLADLGMCKNLTVLLLANNFISKIDALASCSELLKLDLHGNQISRIPEKSFWQGFHRMHIIHLHDNPIGNYSAIDGLSACPRLQFLTLSDTPFSIKRHYRHQVVNKIWSLKALDSHVISDEEIIDGARFCERFAALSPALELPSSVFKGTNETSVRAIWRLIGQVNRILAHHSPVLIIQRYWRGYRARCAIHGTTDMKRWAAVTIQRKYREWKTGRRNGPNCFPASIPPPPCVTPNCDVGIRNSSPGSSSFINSSRYDLTWTDSAHYDLIHRLDTFPSGQISIDWTKFEKSVTRKLTGGNTDCDDSWPTKEGRKADRDSAINRKPLPPQPRKVKNVPEFFDPSVDSGISDSSSETETETDEDFVLAKFRLRGTRQMISSKSLKKEIMEEKQKSGKYVREADLINHETVNSLPKPKVTSTFNSDLSQQQLGKDGSLAWLTYLSTVGREYMKAQAIDKMAERVAYVCRLRELRDGATERISAELEDRRQKAILLHQAEKQSFMEDLEAKQKSSIETKQRRLEFHRKSTQFGEMRRNDFVHVSNFTWQVASCVKANFKFGNREITERRGRLNKMLVNAIRKTEAENRVVRQRFKAYRRHQLQSQGISEKRERWAKISADTRERLEQTKDRVEGLKRAETGVSERGSKDVLILPIVSNL